MNIRFVIIYSTGTKSHTFISQQQRKSLFLLQHNHSDIQPVQLTF